MPISDIEYILRALCILHLLLPASHFVALAARWSACFSNIVSLILLAYLYAAAFSAQSRFHRLVPCPLRLFFVRKRSILSRIVLAINCAKSSKFWGGFSQEWTISLNLETHWLPQFSSCIYSSGLYFPVAKEVLEWGWSHGRRSCEGVFDVALSWKNICEHKIEGAAPLVVSSIGEEMMRKFDWTHSKSSTPRPDAVTLEFRKGCLVLKSSAITLFGGTCKFLKASMTAPLIPVGVCTC